jgi:ankyrin repeat protein
VVLRFVEAGADLSHVTVDGRTALTIALTYDHLASARALVQAGATG